MPRHLVPAVALFFLLVAASPSPAAQPPAAQSALDAAIGVELHLLEEDVADYAEARGRESAARKTVDDLLVRMDAALAADATSPPAEIARLAQELEGSRVESDRWGREATRLRQAVLERRRRLVELERRRGPSGAAEEAATDPVSGRWTVRILPSGQLADFRLELDVSLVTGSYQTAAGAVGSLRGTFVGEVLTLERVDTQKGADLIYEGRLDRARGEVRGTWRSTLLSSGEPAAGNWVAFRQSPSPAGGEN